MKKLLLTTALLLSFAANGFAAGAVEVAKGEWSFQGIRGQWDKEQILRGYTVATQVCMGCHSFKYISHRDLTKVGFSEANAKQMAANLELGLDSKLISAMSIEDAQASFGLPVPDLAMMNKARAGGIDYVYALLTGYIEEPRGWVIPEGSSYNASFPGHNIAMPTPLTGAGLVEYSDGTEATVEQMAKDVAYFMQWTAEPELIKRNKLGVYVLLYLLLFTILAYFAKKAIWSRLPKR